MMEMTPIFYSLISLFLGLVAGILAFYVYRKIIEGKNKNSANKEAKRIIHRAKSQAAKLASEARNKTQSFESRARRNVESDIQKQKQKLRQVEQSFKNKESQLERDYKKRTSKLEQQVKDIEFQEEEIMNLKKTMKSSEQTLEEHILEAKRKLSSVAQLSEEQARSELKSLLEDKVQKEISAELNQIEEKIRKEADLKAKKILSTAISRFASEVSTEQTVTIVPLPSEEMKGKIIGREGRNIRAIEASCGVDFIIDETPESVVISSFDPVRRAVAKKSLMKLMEDGRVHPARIEEAVEKAKSELAATILEDGEQACMDAGIHGVHTAIQKLIGSLKYRKSHTQNLFKMSAEVSYVAGLLSAEVGLDPKKAKRAGLLHSIGRAIDHTVEGSYAKVGADFARRHQESPDICQAILVQNDEMPPETLLDHILQAALRLIEARPGVSRKMIDSYIKRLSDLESIGNSFDGVQRTFAVQLGKEIRVIVDSGKITDGQAKMLTRDIAKKIERELNCPGQVKVSVIRETRIVEHAR